MKDEVLVLGGLGLLGILLLGGKRGEGVTAAEGEIPAEKQGIAEVSYQAGESGFGIVKSAPSTLSVSRTSSSTPTVTAVEMASDDPFGGYEFASEKELRKAQLDPSHFEAVTGAGFEWTKQGRYEYKQMLKTQSRQAKASKAGYSSFEEYAAAKDAADLANRREAEAYITSISGGTVESADVGYIAPGTRVYTEEELQQPGYQGIRNAFQKLLNKAGMGPAAMETLPEGADTSHLVSIIDWEKTAQMGESPYA